MNDQDRVNRGQRAAAILTDHLWEEAWEAYRARLLKVMEDSTPDDLERILEAKRMLTAGVEAKSWLARVVIDGKIAAEQMLLEKKKWWRAA